MEETGLKQPALTGRDAELAMLRKSLADVSKSKGSTILIAGEAGLGKTRLVSELTREAREENFRTIQGWCLAESLEPLMPVKAALREAGLTHLVSGSPPPLVVSAYLMNSAGMLIAKAERERLELDSDIFAGMLQAVGNFVKDSLGMMDGGGKGGLNSLGYSDHTILIRSEGKLSLATVIKGKESEFLIGDMKEVLSSFGNTFDHWAGNMAIAEPAVPKISWFIESGKYDGRFLVDDAKLKQENLFDNVLLGLHRASLEKPLLIFLDDLQWADPTTLNLLHYLARNTRLDSILILGTYRPEDIMQSCDGKPHHMDTAMQNMSREGLFERIELSRLDLGSTKCLVDSALVTTDFEPAFYEKILKETDGTPFFVLEVVKLLADEGTISRSESDAWTLSKPLEKLEMPSKVYDVIKRRLDRLTKEQREMLECASVIGEEFSTGILERTCGMAKLVLLKNLSEAEKAHKLLHYRNKRYMFDHAKIREVLYNGIGEELRGEYHRLTADAIAEVHKEDPDAAMNELAYHYFEARDERAGEYLIKSGDRAKEQYANEEAVRFYTKAIGLIGDAEEIDVRSKMADILFLTGEFEKALEELTNALNIAERTGAKTRCYKLRNSIGYIYLELGKIEDARAIFDSTQKDAGETESDEFAADALRGLGKLYWRTGDFDKAIECGLGAIRYYAAKGDSENMAYLYKDLGDAYGERGEHEKGLEFYERSIGMFDPERNLYNIANIKMNMGVIHSMKKDWQRAAECYEECIKDTETAGCLNTMAWALFNLAEAYTKVNLLDKAEESLKRSAVLLEKADDRMGMAGVNMKFGELFQELKRFDEAIPHFQECISTLRELGIMKYLADAVHELGLTYAMMDRKEDARNQFMEAMVLYEKIGIAKQVEMVRKDMEGLGN